MFTVSAELPKRIIEKVTMDWVNVTGRRWKGILTTPHAEVDPKREARFWLIGLIKHKPTCIQKLFGTSDPCKCDRVVNEVGFTCPVCQTNMNIPFDFAKVWVYDPKRPNAPAKEETIDMDHVHLEWSNPEKMTLYGAHFNCPMCTHLYKLEDGYVECLVKLDTLTKTARG